MTAIVLPDMTAVAEEHARRFAEAARAAIAARGAFTVALTGGGAAKDVYPLLRFADVEWPKVHVFWGDERCVPPDHADSNHRLAREAFLAHVPAVVHRMRGEDDPDAAARAYDDELRSVCGAERALDVVHLGVGPDGHVCSLFPGHALLDDARFVAWLDDSPKPPPRRVTLGMPALAAARAIWFLVGGRSKEQPVREALLDPASPLPCARAHRAARSSTWLLDADAARLAKQS
jgi:6-phosphogluconolactonase